VHVKPYHFFQHTGDINAPPGLAKCENDEKEGFDFAEISGEQYTLAYGLLKPYASTHGMVWCTFVVTLLILHVHRNRYTDFQCFMNIFFWPLLKPRISNEFFCI
jgi:hypothetical protein